MKLHRVALEAFRKFREPLELDGLQDGLNLFVGPNEAGKSTVALAIRAAFLERYSTSKVADFAPRGETGMRPSVEVAFSHAGKEYVLRKSFLSRARCELVIDDGAARLDSEQAENALAALLGFELTGRGQSKPEHAGVPGLLWIQQGEGQNVNEPAIHAGVHLRDALTRLSGELSSADGDRLFERVSAERAALLDARGGRPKGIYKEAEEALARAVAEQASLAREKAQLDADVDRLAALRAEYDRAQREEPWKAFQVKAAEARAKLAAITKEREALDGLRREQAQAQNTLALLQDQVARDQRDEDELRSLTAQSEAAETALAVARSALEQATQEQQAVAGVAEAARAHVAAAQALADRQDLDEQITRLGQEVQRLEGAFKEVTALTAQAGALQAQVVNQEVNAKDLRALRALEREFNDLQMQQRAVATRLRYQLLPGQESRLNGSPLSADGDVLLTAAAELDVPGVGRFRIEPGGKDLPGLLAEVERCRLDRDGALARIGVADLAQAEARQAASELAARELDGVRRAIAIHAAQGIDALRASLEDARLRLSNLQSRRAALPPVDDKASEWDLDTAKQRWHDAQARAAHVAQSVSAAQGKLDADAARAQLLHAQAVLRGAEHQSAERTAQRQSRVGKLAEARGAYEHLTQQVASALAALEGHQPQLMEQDVVRFDRSATIARQEQQKRYDELLQLQGKLEQAGAQGLGERLSEVQANCERLQRRRDDIARRAQALDLLQSLLAEKRDAATQRLQAPLARRLNHYLALLFPDASLRLDDALMPVGLRRVGGEDELTALSFGTREQLGILARLAYADLLREAGKPTLLILDDALVHADDARREFMKRALFDAASRHQILMFTCHADAWQDMGVEQRRIA